MYAIPYRVIAPCAAILILWSLFTHAEENRAPDPVISSVSVEKITGSTAEISWNTDIAADSMVVYEDASPPVANSASDADFVGRHVIHLSGLSPCTSYFFYVESEDEFGGTVTDDNVGSYYRFRTLQDDVSNYPVFEPDMPIPDPGAVESLNDVAEDYTIADIDVTLDIDHEWNGDLTLMLISPGGYSVFLSERHGSNGYDYAGTTFDDEATTPIGDGTPPFSGSFIPDSPLYDLDGSSSLGQWKLRVHDQLSPDSGEVNSWNLALTLAEPCGVFAGAEGYAQILDDCSAGGAGDEDGVWDPGEEVTFSLDLVNEGILGLTNVSAAVTPLTGGVTMSDAAADFPDIPVGGTVTSIAPHFTADLQPGLACGTVLVFQVDITSDFGSWTDFFRKEAGAVTPGGWTALDEDFEGATFPPSGWTVVNLETAHTWFLDGDTDPEGCNHRDLELPAPNQWAAVDSWCAFYNDMDEELISPSMDLTTATAVFLEFDHYFSLGSDEIAELDVWVSGARNTVKTWTEGTGNAYHEAMDITALAAGESDVQVGFHYYDASFEKYWYVDNVTVTTTAPGACAQNPCAASAPPPPAPDGSATTTPLTAERITPSGDEVDVFWDATSCPADDYNLIYGFLSDVSTYVTQGGECLIGTSETHNWLSVPAQDLWFVIVGTDGTGTESSWGTDGDGAERNGPTPSGQCSVTAKDTTQTCP